VEKIDAMAQQIKSEFGKDLPEPSPDGPLGVEVCIPLNLIQF